MSKYVDITITIDINGIPYQMTTGFLADGYDDIEELTKNIRQRIEESLKASAYICMNTAYIAAKKIIEQNNIKMIKE
jgi:hypothetical protein